MVMLMTFSITLKIITSADLEGMHHVAHRGSPPTFGISRTEQTMSYQERTTAWKVGTAVSRRMSLLAIQCFGDF